LSGRRHHQWPRAQQSSIPLIGFLNSSSRQLYHGEIEAFLKGLGESGFVDGQNVKIEYRWAEGHSDRLPAMVADLVAKKVAVIAATSAPAALAAKAGTTTTPIVFETGFDPVHIGLVANLRQPGGNVTGVTQMNALITSKRLELLQEFVPKMKLVAFLVNSRNAVLAEIQRNEAKAAADSLGVKIKFLDASTEADLDEAFANLAAARADGLVIGSDGFFRGQSEQLGALAARHSVPAAFETRAFVTSGGLLSYGGSSADSYRLAGVYVGRILKGERPADLPVQQGTKVELFVNEKAAKALGLIVPLPLSGRADEIIE
jgi:putative ABC transport system substrate-binding protein